MAELGPHAGGHDDADAAPGRDLRARVRHAQPVAEGEVGPIDLLGLLVDRLGLAGERRLLDAQAGHLDQAEVGRNDRAGVEMDDVTGTSSDTETDVNRPSRVTRADGTAIRRRAAIACSARYSW